MNEKYNLKRIKEDTTLTREHKDIVIGTLLGDSFIKFNQEKNSASLSLGPKINNTKYMSVLHQKIKFLCTLPGPEMCGGSVKKYIKARALYIVTISIRDALFPFADLFFSDKLNASGNRIKIIPSVIEELLNPRVLAY